MKDAHGEGRRRERVVADRYRTLGFEVWQPPRTKFGTQDIFGVGDLLVVGMRDRFIVQVCDKKSAKRHQDAVCAWNDLHCQELFCVLHVWGDDPGDI